MKKKGLSNNPGVALEQALKDLEILLRSPKYIAKMSSWVCPSGYDNTCEICLAGASIVRRLKQTGYFSFYNINQQTGRKIKAINYFRMGEWRDGLRTFLNLYFLIEETTIPKEKKILNLIKLLNKKVGKPTDMESEKVKSNWFNNKLPLAAKIMKEAF